jgi:hypothetical protein
MNKDTIVYLPVAETTEFILNKNEIGQVFLKPLTVEALLEQLKENSNDVTSEKTEKVTENFIEKLKPLISDRPSEWLSKARNRKIKRELLILSIMSYVQGNRRDYAEEVLRIVKGNNVTSVQNSEDKSLATLGSSFRTLINK